MVEAYIQEKAQGLRNYMNSIRAVEAGLELAIHRAVRRRTNPQHVRGQLPDYSAIAGNDELKEDISDAIDEAYSMDNELHPLYGVVNQERLERNFYNQVLLEDILFPHRNTVKNRVGENNFMDILYGERAKSQQRLQQRLIAGAAGATVAEHDLEPLKEYLTATYGALGAELDAVAEKERLTRAIAMDYMRLLGANIGADQIREALRNPAGE